MLNLGNPTLSNLPGFNREILNHDWTIKQCTRKSNSSAPSFSTWVSRGILRSPSLTIPATASSPWSKKNTWMHVKSSSRGGTLQHVKSLQWHMLNMLEIGWTKLHHVEIWSPHHVPVDMMCHSPSDLSTFIVDAPTRIVRYRHSPPDHSKGFGVWVSSGLPCPILKGVQRGREG